MELKHVQAIEGANYYSYRSVIKAVVDLGEWAGKTSNESDGFNFRLLECLPTLVEHYCSRGKPGGFLERLKEGTLFGHILEHITIELLILAGQKIPYGKTLALSDDGREYEVIFNYDSREGAIEALYQAFTIIGDLIQGRPIDVAKTVARIEQVIAENELGPSTKTIVEACKKRDIPVQRLNDGSLLQLGYGRYQRRIQATMTDQTQCIAVDIACDKGLTKRLLHEGGIPVPRGRIVKSEEDAVNAFHKLGGEAVVKPYNGNQGKGVTLKLSSEAEVRAAFRVAQTYGEQVIIEEYIKGRHYRLLVIGGRLIAAAERIPAHVIGDGCLNIEQLVAKANSDPLRGEGHEKVLTKIKIDPVVILTLAQKSLTLSSVPKKGEIVYLRDSANLSTGGIACDVTDQVHPDNAGLAIYAAQVIGLDVAGVDLVIEDIAESYSEQNGQIIEVNAAPGIRMHHFPSIGEARDVGTAIVDQVLPRGNGRIPIVSITGTNGKTTTTRMIGKMLMDHQLCVGMTTTDGIYINGKPIVKGDRTGPESARIVLRHPETQVAVLETARGGILRAGLGYDYADVAVVTNVGGDHLGQYGIETIADIAHVKSLVAEVVKPHSYVILNADDALVVPMAKRTKGRVIFFSVEKDNIHVRKHLARGGTAVFVRRGGIILCQGTQIYRICTVKRLPVTWEGKAKHNIQNALAAVAVGWALGLSSDAIRESLENFASDKADNRGRLNLYEINGVRVFVDYGHNAAGIKEIIQTVKKFKAGSLVGCLTVPGDRPDESIREAARIAAKGFQRLIIREDGDLRGRRPGEIAGIIYNEALAAGMDSARISIILNEREAFQYGMDSCHPGEIFVMFYEQIEPIEEVISLRLNRASICNGYQVGTVAVGEA